MSSAISGGSHTGDRRRALASAGATLLVHAALLAALALGVGISGAPSLASIPIDLQVSGSDAFAASAGSTGAPAGGAHEVAGSSMGSFTIPVPHEQATDSASAAPVGTSSFREAGARTGTAQEIPSVPSPLPSPSLPAVQESRSGEGSLQRSGTGVSTGSSGSSSGGSLDLGRLDKALAGRGTGAGGSLGAGDSGSGTGTAGGSGSGKGGQRFNVIWGGGDSGRGRTLLFSSLPRLPSWVSAQGLTLSVTVSFTLLGDGTIGGVDLTQSSGYADVDAAVVDAIRRWRFTPAEGAPPARGLIPYVIRAH